MRRSSGFTLLELLVSISIFSVLGLGTYQMLQTIGESHDRVKLSADTYTQLNLTFATLQRDFNQFIPRPVRDEYGEPLSPILFENDDYIVEFTRGGWSNPAGRPRSRLQRVAYSVDYDEETLTRHFWEVLDRAEDSEPVSRLLMSGVSEFRVTGFSGDESSLESTFSLEEVGDAAPLAVEVVLVSAATGEVTRMFQLVDPYLPIGGTQDQQTGDEQPGENPDEGINNPDGSSGARDEN